MPEVPRSWRGHAAARQLVQRAVSFQLALFRFVQKALIEPDVFAAWRPQEPEPGLESQVRDGGRAAVSQVCDVERLMEIRVLGGLLSGVDMRAAGSSFGSHTATIERPASIQRLQHNSANGIIRCRNVRRSVFGAFLLLNFRLHCGHLAV